MSMLVRAAIFAVVLGQIAVFVVLLWPSGSSNTVGASDAALGGPQPKPVTLKRALVRDRIADNSGSSGIPGIKAIDPLPNIHMVYMYANGTDPGITNARARFGGPVKVTSRDRDNGELRFSLRSLDKYAPWFKGDVIILQGDDKPPYWLNLSHPRVKVVNHPTYFLDPSVLPTFSSDAIHVNIHRVPPVQESPILINWCDDFFLGRPVSPEDWVRDGKPVIYFEGNAVRGARPEYDKVRSQGGNKWLAKIYQTRAVIEERFPDEARRIKKNFVKHAPFPMSLQMLREMADVFKAEYNRTARSRFRTYDTVDVPTLHNYYCQVRNACVLDSQAAMDQAATLFVLTNKDADNYQKILKSFVADPPKFFTFNDGFGQNPPSSVKFAFEELLPAMFPERSQYELAEAPSGLSVK